MKRNSDYCGFCVAEPQLLVIDQVRLLNGVKFTRSTASETLKSFFLVSG